VAAGDIPRETGVQMLAASFPIGVDEAEKIMGDVGAGFEAKPKPVPPPFGGAVPPRPPMPGAAGEKPPAPGAQEKPPVQGEPKPEPAEPQPPKNQDHAGKPRRRKR
jgi:hypothetical protein